MFVSDSFLPDICQCTMCMLGACGGKKMVLDGMEVEQQIILSCYVSGGN